MDFYKILCVASGGFMGSILRYRLSSMISKNREALFPYGTIFVNISGSFLLGAIVSINRDTPLNPYLLLFLTSGFAGAFTTFSTAMYEQYKLIEDKEKKEAVLYFLYTIVGGMLSAILGYQVFKN